MGLLVFAARLPLALFWLVALVVAAVVTAVAAPLCLAVGYLQRGFAWLTRS
jgi:predicted Abi (CAAX) family protease